MKKVIKISTIIMLVFIFTGYVGNTNALIQNTTVLAQNEDSTPGTPRYQTAMFYNNNDLIEWLQTENVEDFQEGRYKNGISSWRDVGKVLIPSFENLDMYLNRIEVFLDGVIGFYYFTEDRRIAVTVVKIDDRYAEQAEKVDIAEYAVSKYGNAYANAPVIQMETDVKYQSSGEEKMQEISYVYATATDASGNPIDGAIFLIDGFEIRISQKYNNQEQKQDKKYINDLCLKIIPIEDLSAQIDPLDEITVTLNDRRLKFDVAPIIENGRTLVPMRKIFESLGAKVEWDGETQTVTAVRVNDKISLQIGSYTLIKNGQRINLDVPAKIINGRTLVPIRAISNTLGALVDWDDETQTVMIIN